MMKQQSVKKVSTPQIACDGGGGAAGHPKIYLQIAPSKDRISCPYCSKLFMLKE